VSGRTILAQALRAGLPGWQIVADARALDPIRRPGAAVLWTASRRKAPALGLDWFADELTLWVLTATDKPEQLEDDLDGLLLQLLEVLEPLTAFAWEQADRGVLADKFEGWRLTVTCCFQLTPTPDPDNNDNEED
jgi:hypothetical protein